MGFLTGKRALIVGIASQRSIASGIADAMHREGAELAFTYQNDKLKSRVEDAAAEYGAEHRAAAGRRRRRADRRVFSELGKHWDGFDILVHSVGFAPREAHRRRVPGRPDPRELPHRPRHLQLQPGGAGQGRAADDEGPQRQHPDLSYLGAERALANYNVMGLAKASLEANVRYLALNLGPEGTRVNAISAGPIKTLAAAGIANFRKMLQPRRAARAAAPQRHHRGRRQRRPRSCARTWPPASPAKSPTSTRGYNILGMTGIERRLRRRQKKARDPGPRSCDRPDRQRRSSATVIVYCLRRAFDVGAGSTTPRTCASCSCRPCAGGGVQRAQVARRDRRKRRPAHGDPAPLGQADLGLAGDRPGQAEGLVDQRRELRIGRRRGHAGHVRNRTPDFGRQRVQRLALQGARQQRVGPGLAGLGQAVGVCRSAMTRSRTLANGSGASGCSSITCRRPRHGSARSRSDR